MKLRKYEGVTRLEGWVKACRSQDAFDLIEYYPNAYLIATVIAFRARWKVDGVNPYGLQLGEALLGDFERCGMSEKEYRTAKKILERHQYAAFRRANRGTIAKLLDTRLFCVGEFAEGEQKGGQEANRGRTEGEQRAGNEERKTGKNKKNDKTSLEGIANKNPKTVDLMDRCREIFGPDEMLRCHNRWLQKAEKYPARLEIVLNDTAEAVKKGKLVGPKIENPAAWAEEAWQNFSKPSIKSIASN